MRLPLIIGAALLAASTGLYAQAPKDDAKAARQQAKERIQKACEGKQGEERAACVRREVCAQSKDPKACEQRFAKGRETHAKARKACEGKAEGERRDCMRKELCAQSKDPAKCEAQAKEWSAKREKAREACKGKTGDEQRACVREQMGGQRGKK
jgi:phage-related protein